MPAKVEAHSGAHVIHVPPPLYYTAGLVGGLLLNSLVALPLGGRPATVVAGVALAALGLALTFTGVAAVIRHRTTIVPHHPVAILLVGGAYRRSRNPMYTGLAIAYVGLAFLFDSWWPLALWPSVILAVRQLVILPEERYLAERFGQTYTDYQSRVRRWV